jgi:hypothetical protein
MDFCFVDVDVNHRMVCEEMEWKYLKTTDVFLLNMFDW